MTTRYGFVSDPGRRWLKVPHADISATGLLEDVSSLSYVDRTHVYLDENRDAPRFIAALHLQTQTIPTVSHCTAHVLELPPYTPAALLVAANGVSGPHD